jgi:two-component system, OmpR family, sensor kinase
VRPTSLRARLVLASAGAILLAVVVLGAAAGWIVHHELRGTLDRTLRQRAEDVSRLSVSAPAVLTRPGALEAPVRGRQMAVEVLDSRGRFLARSLALGAQLLPSDDLTRAAVRSGRSGFEDVRLGGRPLRLYAAPIPRAGGPAAGGAVLVAADTSDIEDTTRHLALLLVVSGLAAAALAGAAAAFLTRRGLRPLARLSAAAREIERTGDPALRLPPPDARDELAELTDVLNRMLAALQRARESERRFLADASHELRTPVTALLGNVEYAARHGADADVLADLRHDAARLARLVDDLLALERERAAAPAGQPVALDDIVREIAAEEERVELADSDERPGMGRIGGTAGRSSEVTVLGDEDALRRAVRNLVSNALVHGPPGGPVTLAVRAAGGRARVVVSDTGPGPSPADRERLFERFWRGGDAAGRTGSGLGLAIVASIAARHGGSVDVDGSAFTLELPAVSSPVRRPARR